MKGGGERGGEKLLSCHTLSCQTAVNEGEKKRNDPKSSRAIAFPPTSRKRKNKKGKRREHLHLIPSELNRG